MGRSADERRKARLDAKVVLADPESTEARAALDEMRDFLGVESDEEALRIAVYLAKQP